MNNKEKIAVLSAVQELLSSDDEEMVAVIIGAKRRRRRISIKKYINYIIHQYSPNDFKNYFRLRKDTFENLLKIVAPHLELQSTTGVGKPPESPEKQLLICLYILANQVIYKVVSEKFDVAESTARLYVHKICGILCQISKNHINWPTGNALKKTSDLFQSKYGFPNVIGAIDGKHIQITPPVKQKAAYCNRNKYHSIVLQVVCDAEYCFTDVYAGLPGSVQVARVFKNSELGQIIESQPEKYFPKDTHILGDSAYRNYNQLLTPYRNNGNLSKIQETFNERHSSTMTCIKQTFGLLKGRFRILKHVNIYRTELIPPVIIACCVIHNFCMHQDEEDTVEPEQDLVDNCVYEFYDGSDNSGLMERDAIAESLCA